jgi:serine/threonine-protein kinase
MPLTIGSQLGSHEIVALLGKGGMGEVYRARDLKLKREVAIKVLPEDLSLDADRVSRFQREAEMLASLNHPNIAGIYDLAEADGTRFLILELVEGQTLADRISRGPVPVEEALTIAKQICDALEAAHEKGIVHRDLKPANIKLAPEGNVKVLDFGLAKAIDGLSANAATSNSPTLLSASVPGVILGTAAYMSPEQARGRSVDKRADIWAFGVVLHEMLTGRTVFPGEDVTSILAKVIESEPSWQGVPLKFQRLLKKCLEKDPKKRLRDIGDAWELLSESETHQQAQQRTNKLAWMLGALAVILTVAVGLLSRSGRPVRDAFMDFPLDLGRDPGVGSTLITAAVTRDGSRIAFLVGTAGGKRELATRSLAQHEPVLLTGTEGADSPFFSPDGQWLGFFADGQMKKISIAGGPVVPLCPAPGPRGAAWGEDGYIILTPASTTGVGLSRVPDSGGPLQSLTKPADKGEATHRWPQILPGGREVLFTGNTITGSYEDANMEVLSLDSGQWKTVHRGGYFGRVLPSGHLIYVHQGTLFAVPFDLNRLEVRAGGRPVPLLDGIVTNPNLGIAQFDFSQDGTFIYLGSQPRTSARIVWVDSSGHEEPLLSTPGLYSSLRISPVGPRLALVAGPAGGEGLEIFNWETNTLTPLTSATGGTGVIATQLEQAPVWAPDGKHLAFTSHSPEGYSIQWIRADGPVEPLVLLKSRYELRASSFSPDGKRLAYAQDSPDNGMDIWVLPLDITDADRPNPGAPEPFLRTPAFESDPIWSPDGRWIAYLLGAGSARTGGQVFVRPYPGPGGAWPISTGGQPFWSQTELFFLSSDSRIMATPYSANSGSFPAMPHLWSAAQVAEPGIARTLDIAPDGKHFAVIRTADANDQNRSLHVTALLNFFDWLGHRVPVR